MNSFATISPVELAARVSAGAQLLIVDVRTPAEFREVHAQGARNLPLPEVTPAALSALIDEGEDAPVYILCQAGKRAEVACARLQAGGVARVILVTGGTDAWVAAGLPVTRGSPGAIGIERQVRIGAGVLVGCGVALACLVHPDFIWLAGLVGAGLVFAGVTGFCGMGLLLAKAPWNR